MSSSLRRAVWAAAAATAGTVALTGGPAAAQVDPCYPPTPACASTSSSTSFPAPTLPLPDTIGDDGNASGGTGSGANLARTGAVVIPTALVGVGLVAGGVVLKRSSRRDKTSSAA